MINKFFKTNTKFMETMAQRLEQAYIVFYNSWNVTMIPKLMKREMLFISENLRANFPQNGPWGKC